MLSQGHDAIDAEDSVLHSTISVVTAMDDLHIFLRGVSDRLWLKRKIGSVKRSEQWRTVRTVQLFPEF